MAGNEAEKANQEAEEARKRDQINQATLKDAKGLENRLGQYLWINLSTSKNHKLDPVAVKQGVLSVCGDQAKKIFTSYLSNPELEKLLQTLEDKSSFWGLKISQLGQKVASALRQKVADNAAKNTPLIEDESYKAIHEVALAASVTFREVFQNPNNEILVQKLVNRVLKDRLVEISGLDEAGKSELSQKLDSITSLWALEQANLSNEVKAKYLSSPGKHWTKAQNAQEAFDKTLCDLITLSTQEQLEKLSLNQLDIANASLKFRLIEKTGLSDAEQEKLAAKLDQIKYLWSLDKDNYSNSSKMEYLKNSMRYNPAPQNANEAFDGILHDLITLSTQEQLEKLSLNQLNIANASSKFRLIEKTDLSDAEQEELAAKLDQIKYLWSLDKDNYSNSSKMEYLENSMRYDPAPQNANEAFNQILEDLLQRSTAKQLQDFANNYADLEKNLEIAPKAMQLTILNGAIEALKQKDKKLVISKEVEKQIKEALNSIFKELSPEYLASAYTEITQEIADDLYKSRDIAKHIFTNRHELTISDKTLDQIADRLETKYITSLFNHEKEQVTKMIGFIKAEKVWDEVKACIVSFAEKHNLTAEIEFIKKIRLAEIVKLPEQAISAIARVRKVDYKNFDSEIYGKIDDLEKEAKQQKGQMDKHNTVQQSSYQINLPVHDVGVRERSHAVHSNGQNSNNKQKAELTIPPMVATAAELQGAISQLHHNQEVVHHNQATENAKQDSKASSDLRHNSADLDNMGSKPPPLPPKHHAPNHSTTNFPDPKDKPAKPPRKHADRVRPQPQQQSDGLQSKSSPDFPPQDQKPPKPPRHKSSDKITPPPLPPKKSHTERVHNSSRSDGLKGFER